MTENYSGFAVETAKQIVSEETYKLHQEIIDDVGNLMAAWGDRVLDRINARMEDLGISQNLEVTVSWDPEEMPMFMFRGATFIGEGEPKSE